MFEGSLDSRVLFISDFQRINCRAEGKIFGEHLWQILNHAIQTVGLTSDQYSVYCLHPHTPQGGQDVERIEKEVRSLDLENFKGLLRQHKANVIVPLGEYAMSVLTGLESISKWHCSTVLSTAEFGQRKCIPMFHPEHVRKLFSDHFYLSVGMQKVKKQMWRADLVAPLRITHLNPPFQQTLNYLKNKVAKAKLLSIDIETGRGQINTVGFAISRNEAIAIKTLPDDYTPEQHLALWKAIAEVLEGPQPKLLQNFIYEDTWFSRYGIKMQNVIHDTMWAQKFLHPELDKGLDNVGRIYTDFPYWKDDNDSWNNIKDWNRHLDYNCKDTIGTFEGYLQQTDALKERKLDRLFCDFVMRFAPVISEMCTNGLGVDAKALVSIQEKIVGERDNFLRLIETECQARIGRTINPRSPKQLKEALKELGIKLPTTNGEESSDKKTLVKLTKKYPNEEILKCLIGLSAKNKQLSSYIDFDYDRTTNRVHYQLDGNGTETGRWSGTKSGWGEGFNPQTVPKSTRRCFVADPGKLLVQVDLSQAESRFVAWDAPEPRLMEMLSRGEDVHKFVASHIFKKSPEFISKKERDLGKKSGHAANYDVGPRTFADACLVEMDMFLTEQEARQILMTYNSIFPGIRRRKENIQKQLRQFRMLRTPIGRERHFYGRMDDSTFREAYAYAPQSTIPDITNCLMLKLWELRDNFELEFLLQVHDSLLLQVPKGREYDLADMARDSKSWHPKITLAGGDLIIPVDVEVGTAWHPMQKI